MCAVFTLVERAAGDGSELSGWRAPPSFKRQQPASGAGSGGYDSKGMKLVRTLSVWTRPDVKSGAGWEGGRRLGN